MGVSLAWPVAQFSLEEIQAKKIGETVDWPQQKRNAHRAAPHACTFAVLLCHGLVSIGAGCVCVCVCVCVFAGKWTKEKPPFNARQEALRRHNCSIIARLRSKET